MATPPKTQSPKTKSELSLIEQAKTQILPLPELLIRVEGLYPDDKSTPGILWSYVPKKEAYYVCIKRYNGYQGKEAWNVFTCTGTYAECVSELMKFIEQAEELHPTLISKALCDAVSNPKKQSTDVPPHG